MRISQEGVLAVAFLIVLGLQSCIVVIDRDDFDERRLYRTDWRLERLVENGRSYRPGRSDPYTLAFETRSHLDGVGDCNAYDASYETSASGRLSVYDFSATEVACSPGSFETLYFDGLVYAESYSVRGDELTIVSDDGHLRLYFRRD